MRVDGKLGAGTLNIMRDVRKAYAVDGDFQVNDVTVASTDSLREL